MKPNLPSLCVAALVALAFTNCERHKTVAERAEDAANQAKAQNDPSTYPAIEEAKRIAAETGQPVKVKVTQRVDVSQPEGAAVPRAQPVLPPVYVPPPTPGVVIEPVEPERTPGQKIDNALQKAGRGLQKLGEKIEDRADR